MAITVVPKSASLTITSKPSVDTPSVSGTDMTFECKSDFGAKGECKITGDGADNPVGWILGIIQMQWIETNWGYYRGQSNADGSIFLQRARAPARPAQACRDTLTVGGIFVDNNPGKDRTEIKAASAFPISMSAEFTDGPHETYALTRTNSKTKKLNYLQEVQLEFHFCTVLSLRSPALTYQHLKHVLWNVHWQARFKPTDFSDISKAWTITLNPGKLANSANVSPIADGGPTDKRFTGVLTAGAAPNCNAVATKAAGSPNVKESSVWESFDVTR